MIKGGMRLRTSVWSARWLVHRAAHQQRAFALPRSGGGGGGGGGRGGTPADEEEVAAARKWLAKFDADTIPRSICDVSFSRSSGPGGQNVNKTSSKAQLRVSVSALLPLLPTLIIPQVLTSRYCTAKSDALVIQADDSRKAKDNEQSCYKKLYNIIFEAATEAIPGETSLEQSERVKRLQKAENEGRLRMKKQHSDKKSSRRGGGKADY